MLEQYRGLAHRHLGALPSLFKGLTGMNVGVVWAPAWPRRWNVSGLPTQSWLCRQGAASTPAVQLSCQRCHLRHLRCTLKSADSGHRFVCHQGVRNFWFLIIIRHFLVCVAYVQARDRAVLKRRGGPQGGGASISPAPRPGSAAGPGTAGSEFEWAAGLVRLIGQHVRASVLADLRQEELTKAQQALEVFEKVQQRLREELNSLMPAVLKTPPVPEPDSRSKRVVAAVLNRIQHDYAQPLSLGQCARELRLNPAYLSHLFSKATGLSFRSCLTEVRIEKARELLRDPALNICDVAYAVGFHSENRLRLSFKKVTGLPPRRWRETLHMSPRPLVQSAGT